MRHFLRCLLPLIAVASFDLPAAAAPQILLAVASENTVPMRCDIRHCEAEIGTICLQPYRSDPARGARGCLCTLGDGVLPTGLSGDEVKEVSVPPDCAFASVSLLLLVHIVFNCS